MKAHILRKKRSSYVTGFHSRHRHYSPNQRTRVQTALKVSEPSDEYEQQADRVADQVLHGKPTENIHGVTQAQSQRMCETCKEKDVLAQTKTKGDSTPIINTTSDHSITASPPNLTRGKALPHTTKAFMESRFSESFDDVRIHTDQAAAQSAQAIGAYAYTLGNHVVFGDKYFQPESQEGKHLLAHELTHVLQQRKTQQAMVSAKWIIDNPNQVQVAGGESNETLLEDAFQDICPLAQVMNHGSDRVIKTTSGSSTPNRAVGCDCLHIIDNDVALLEAGTPGFLQAIPRINIAVNGWSFTSPDPNNPIVSVRHPEDPFQWGYWTANDQRQQKEFFRTVTHEVCGHMSAEIQGVSSGRASTRGHNEAIIRENAVAAEHGVSNSDQRGLDMNEGGVSAGAHRGESFLRAQVYFPHDSDVADPTQLATVVSGVINTIQFFASNLHRDVIRVQLEGYSFSNEVNTMAEQRIAAVTTAISTNMSANSIADPFSAQNTPRFAQSHSMIIFGESIPTTSDPVRKVDVFLFHKNHSAR